MKYEHTKKQKAYLPADVPENLRERLCQTEAECLDPSWMGESVGDYLAEKLAEKGIGEFKIEGWQLHSQGAGVSMTFEVVDLGKFLDSTGLSADAKRRIKGADSIEGVSLSACPSRGFCPGTVPDVSLQNPHQYQDGQEAASTAMQDSLDNLEELWTDLVRDTESEVHRAIEADYEYLTSWEQVQERLENMGEMVTEDGTVVDASECEAITEED